MRTGESTDLTAEVISVSFQNPATGFTVLRVARPGAEQCTACGPIPFPLREGESLHLTGRWITHERFGRQFEFASARVDTPSRADGVVKYLISRGVRGVARGMAERIVSTLGPQALHLILDDQHSLRRIKGLGARRAATLRQALMDSRAEQDAFVTMAGLGLNVAQARAVWEAFGAASAAVVTRNPWSLTGRIPGIGFRTADAIALKQGLAADAPDRLRAALRHTLASAMQKGHAALPRHDLLQACAELVQVTSTHLENALSDSLRARDCTQAVCGRESLVYLRGVEAMEAVVAAALVRLCAAPARHQKPNLIEAQVTLTPDQRAAAELMLTARCAVLTGGPGVGKTTVLRSVVASFLAAGREVCLTAPTGRAARRLSEVTGQPASTLHRAFGLIPGAAHLTDTDTLDELDVLLVDEASMLDLELAAQVLRRLPPHATLLFSGDADQLPPVGPGSVFADLIASDIAPVARLEQIHRQAAGSVMVAQAHAILHGELPRFDAPQESSDCFFMQRRDASEGAALIAELVTQRLPARYGLDPVTEIQVITPMHAGACGTESLNQLLKKPRADGASTATGGFSVGDRVMMTRNDYQRGIMNGDIGIVTAAPTPPAELRVDFDGRTVNLDAPALADLVHAYAITVHKAQGGEFPAVVLALFREHHPMLQRNLLYTAMTRARRLLVIVGQPEALQQAVRATHQAQRHGFLRQRLAGAQVTIAECGDSA